jgi:hypothetical protein
MMAPQPSFLVRAGHHQRCNEPFFQLVSGASAWVSRVRFLILLPSSFVALFLDYVVGVLLFGPNPSTWLASVYYMGVAIAAGAMQLFVAWTIRKRA